MMKRKMSMILIPRGICWNILPLQSNLKENEKKYYINEFPVFTQAEKRLLAAVGGFFQKKKEKPEKKI